MISTTNKKRISLIKTIIFVFIVFLTSQKSLATPVTANLQLWLDADDATTITDGSNRVQQWMDKSGNTRHATMTNNGFKPYTNTYTQNNRNVLAFYADLWTLVVLSCCC